MKNRKIQLRLVPNCYSTTNKKDIQYRILPSELNWFQRIFNRWKNIYHYFGTTPGFKPDWTCWTELSCIVEDFDHYKKLFKTEQDILKYKEIQDKNFNSELDEYNKWKEKYNTINY